jgi:hypothetical protein
MAARIVRILSEGDDEWVARSVLAERLGGHEPSPVVGAALEQLEREGRVERRVVSTSGRAREEWRLAREAAENPCEKTGKDGESPEEPDDEDLSPSNHVFPQTISDDEDTEPDHDEDDWETWEEAI